MENVLENIKKLFNKCDLLFKNNIISKEVLIKNYHGFLADNFHENHNIAISLHTGSICFDIVSVLMTALSNILFNQETVYDFINSLQKGDLLLYGRDRCEFLGFGEPYELPSGETTKRIIIKNERIDHGYNAETERYIPEKDWNQIKPYYGNTSRLDGRGIRTDNTKRNDFLVSVLEMNERELPAFFGKSSVIVMDKSRSKEILENLEIRYKEKTFKITDIMPVSYCSEREYSYSGNPGRIEPAIKITNSISRALDLITGKWSQKNASWKNDIVGVSIIGIDAIMQSKSEVEEIMRRRKLKYVFLSYNISAEEGETILGKIENTSKFICTSKYLKKNSAQIQNINSITSELQKQVESVINHKTVIVPVKTVDCDWTKYKKIQKSFSTLRMSGNRISEDFIPLAYSLLNIVFTAVFPIKNMENLVKNQIIAVESPSERIKKLKDLKESYNGQDIEAADVIMDYLEKSYEKLFSDSEKEKVLFDILEKHKGKKIAIVVPKAYYKTILINGFDKKFDSVQFFTVNVFDTTQHYDLIISIGPIWGKKFDPFKCCSAPEINVIVSDVEENLLKYRKKSALDIERKYNEYVNISDDTYEETIDYDDSTDEEISQIINNTIDISAYINEYYDTKKFSFVNANMGSHANLTEVYYVGECTDDEKVFFTKKYRAYVFDNEKEDVIEVPIENLQSMSEVIFKSNGSETKDIVSLLLDKYLEDNTTVKEEIKRDYYKSQYWKNILKQYKDNNNLTFKELSKQLEKYGSKKSNYAISSWISEESYIVGPHDKETYEAIAKMTNDSYMMEDPISFYKACESIRSIRIGILKLIANAIISKYNGKLTDDSEMAKVVSENIDNISTLVQIERIIRVENLKMPINMVNRPISLN